MVFAVRRHHARRVEIPREVSPATRGTLSNKSLTTTRSLFIALPPISGCGASLASEEATSVEWRQVHDLPPLKIIVTEHRVESKRCPHCGTITHATFPEDVKYPVQYGPNLKALMVYLSIYQLLPYDRVRELFSDLFNCCPGTGTMVNASLSSVPVVLWELKSRFVSSSKMRRFCMQTRPGCE